MKTYNTLAEVEKRSKDIRNELLLGVNLDGDKADKLRDELDELREKHHQLKVAFSKKENFLQAYIVIWDEFASHPDFKSHDEHVVSSILKSFCRINGLPTNLSAEDLLHDLRVGKL